MYGLLSSFQPTAATPTFEPGSQSFSGLLNVSIKDSSPGAAIYYTTDGSAPNLNSTLYTGPIPISSTTTLTAVAAGGGYLPSSASSALFQQNWQAPAPVFSAAGGTYNSPQVITLTDAASNAVIYYTLDGSTPNVRSAVYQGPIAIGTDCTLSAIAVLPGQANSSVVTAQYSFATSSQVFAFSRGFSSSLDGSANPQMILNGSSRLDDTRLQITDGGYFEAGSAYYSQPVDIRSFVTDFSFQISNAGADGFTFVIQASGPNALGGRGGALGYGEDGTSAGIAKSVAIKFDVFDNDGEGSDSTGLFLNGSRPLNPGLNLRSAGIDLSSGDTMQVHLSYDGATLGMTITDGVTYTNYSTKFSVDIPGTVGSPTAHVGFTAGTGGETASQKIMNWAFSKIDVPSR